MFGISFILGSVILVFIGHLIKETYDNGLKGETYLEALKKSDVHYYSLDRKENLTLLFGDSVWKFIFCPFLIKVESYDKFIERNYHVKIMKE